MTVEAGKRSTEAMHFPVARAKFAVIIPYSSNVAFIDGKPQHDLSIHSRFVTEVAKRMQKSGYVEHILLCGEQTFGKNHPVTTTTLMRNMLTSGENAIDPSSITAIEGRNLNSTPFQVRALRNFKRQHNLTDSDLLLVDLSFHDSRIRTYLRAHKVNFPTISADSVAPFFAPDLPIPPIPHAYLRREKTLHRLAQTIDPKGYIPTLLTFFRGGFKGDGMILDTGPDGKLEKIRGSKKLRRGY